MNKIIIFLGIVIIVMIYVLLFFNPNRTDTYTNSLNQHSDSKYDSEKVRQLYGFYSPYDILMEPFDYRPEIDPYPATTTCHAFTVLDGDEELISYYRNLVERGNTVNSIDKKINQLVLNIETDNYPESEKKKIFASNQQSAIYINARMKPMGESDASYCYSFIELVTAKK